MAIRVFISHAAKDEKLAAALVEFLQGHLVLADDEIRCTSVSGHKLPVGSDSSSTLRDDLGDSAVIVGLITSNALSSGWVLFELGAAWGSKKNLKPLLTDDVNFNDLPGPLSGQHSARLSNKADLSQLIEEIAGILQAKRRAAAKTVAVMDYVIDAHAAHMRTSVSALAKVRVEPRINEPEFSGIPYSELVKILDDEKVKIPKEVSGIDEATEVSLLTLYMGNARFFMSGIQSNSDKGSPAAFLYTEVGLRMLPYGLLQFEKLPAAQAKWFKRLVVSSDGNKFIAHYNRVAAKS
ncbi:toll/interleukin-1 receptor domain-containing protein [Stenotrophomonas nematodicola]|uniref:Toll/interleukin-1 receptor domain-containing protein n=1 Tax=Stenotrophomonas nematodicola TaxID=2656746 RepID=A0ABW7CY06_9GAMM